MSSVEISRSLLDAAAEFIGGRAASWPNIDFQRPDGTYYEVRLFPAPTRRMYVGSTARDYFFGAMQIKVCAKKDAGQLAVDALVDAVVKAFPKDRKLGACQIIRTPERGPLLIGDTHTETPVTIRYGVLAKP